MEVDVDVVVEVVDEGREVEVGIERDAKRGAEDAEEDEAKGGADIEE